MLLLAGIYVEFRQDVNVIASVLGQQNKTDFPRRVGVLAIQKNFAQRLDQQCLDRLQCLLARSQSK